MAKGGPAISAGPTIASSRGGTPLGVRVGGIEGGRSIPVSPAEAKITKLFGPAITSPRQIGFKSNPKPGAESVRSLVPFSFPIRGENQVRPQNPPEVKPNVTRFPQARQVKPVLRGETQVNRAKILFAGDARASEIGQPKKEVGPELPIRDRARVANIAERAAARSYLIDPHIFANRIRALARLRGVRSQVGRLVSAETLPVAQTQPQAGTAQEISTQTVRDASPKPKTEAGIPKINIVSGGAVNSDSYKRTLRVEDRHRRYKAIDGETNSIRRKALAREFDAIKAENPSEQVAGSVLERRSLFATRKAFLSEIFYQRGELDKEDGGRKRIALMLSSIIAVNKAQLEELVAGNTAIKETSEQPAELPTNREVDNVFNPPNSPISHSEPVIVEKITERIIQEPEMTGPQIAVLPVKLNPVIQTQEVVETVQEQVKDNIVMFPDIFDTEVDNNIVNMANIRRQLILAA